MMVAHAQPVWTMLRLRRAFLGLGILALLAIGGLGSGLRDTTLAYQQEAAAHRAASLLVLQTALEQRHFADTVVAAALSGNPARWAALPAHLRALRERLAELAALDMAWENPGLAGLHAAMPGMRANLAALEAELAVGDDPLPRLIPLLTAFEAPLRAASVRLLTQEQDQARDAMLALAGKLVIFALGFMLLVAASGGLLALLVAAGRRTRGALRQARAAEAEARNGNRTLTALIDGVPALIATFDMELRCLHANRAVQEFSGRPAGQLVGRTAAEIARNTGLEKDLRLVRETGQPVTSPEREVRDSAGQPRCLLSTTVPLFDEEGRLDRILRTSLDVTQRRRAEEQVRHAAEHDTLTGLPNRLRFKAELGARLGAADGQGLALHVIDLDGFRSVNDTHGQAMGDALLVAVARRLAGLVRPHDMLARLGGDEFALLQRINTAAESLALAARITQGLAQPYQLGPLHIRCPASLGVATLTEGEISAETMLARADLALASARRDGTGHFKPFTPEMEGEALVRRQLQTELIEALGAGALHLAYQPKFTMSDGRMEGVEALLRWTHPVHGPISPGEFVPLAEEAGLALPLARFVLHRAAAQITAWQAIGLDMPVAVNLSGELIGTEEALRMVETVLRETGIPARLLEIEVTESTFIGDSEAARNMLLGLRRLGIRVALDDFGTGFSSLAYLQKLPIDVLKVDRCFVAGLEAGGASARIVDTVVRLAHGLGARVVAEGVETDAQLEALRKLGCDSVQGFLLGRPQPADDIVAMLQRTQTRETNAIPA